MTRSMSSLKTGRCTIRSLYRTHTAGLRIFSGTHVIENDLSRSPAFHSYTFVDEGAELGKTACDLVEAVVFIVPLAQSFVFNLCRLKSVSRYLLTNLGTAPHF